jgi:hypothetical protein
LFSLPMMLPPGVATGTVDVRARVTDPDPAIQQLSGNTSVSLGTDSAQPMLFRRGPISGNRLVPAATFLFSRTERARFEFAASADAKPGAGRLLDRGGQPLAIPVTVAERTDDKTGQHWISADLTLAALAAGDYGLELTLAGPAGTRRLLTAFRVGR